MVIGKGTELAVQRCWNWFSESSRTVIGEHSVDFRNVRVRALGLLRILLKQLWGLLGEPKIDPWRALNRAKSVPRASKSVPRASQERPKSDPRAVHSGQKRAKRAKLAARRVPEKPQELSQGDPERPLGQFWRPETRKKCLPRIFCSVTRSRRAFEAIFQ